MRYTLFSTPLLSPALRVLSKSYLENNSLARRWDSAHRSEKVRADRCTAHIKLGFFPFCAYRIRAPPTAKCAD